MTKHMANSMNMPTLEEALKMQGIDVPSQDTDAEQEIGADEKIDYTVFAKLEEAENIAKRIADLGGADHERSMDQIHDETLKQAQELMELGFNMDQGKAARMFEVAASFYKHAMDAKNSKRDGQLKLLKLMLDERKVKIEEKRSGETTDAEISDVVIVGDRNDILKRAKEAALLKKG